MNFRRKTNRKFQFSMQALMLVWMFVGTISGFGVRALHAAAQERRQTIALELQSAEDWLAVLEKNREELAAELGPNHNNVLRLDQMIRAGQNRINRLTELTDEL